MGGQFVKSKKDVDPKMRDVAQEKMDAEDAARKKKVTKDIGINLINNQHFKR
jgi:hypothetical protein